MAQWNKPVMTNKGLEILNDALGVDNIEITNVKVSSKKLSENLENVTTLDEIKKVIPISSILKIDDKIKITAIINNSGNTAGYNLETIGIYASKNSQEILIAIITAENSDFVPEDSGKGIVTINFELFLNINRNANFYINHNTNALLTLQVFDENVNKKLVNKADKEQVITNLKITNNDLIYTKNNEDITLNFLEASETSRGMISLTKVKEVVNGLVTNDRIKEQSLLKIQEFGIGNTSHVKEIDLNKILPTGIYSSNHNSKLFNLTNSFINFSYNRNLGVQLIITEEEKPRIVVRSRKNVESYYPEIEIFTENNLKFATFEEIWREV